MPASDNAPGQALTWDEFDARRQRFADTFGTEKRDVPPEVVWFCVHPDDIRVSPEDIAAAKRLEAKQSDT